MPKTPRPQGHTEAVNAVAVTPDGRHAVSGSSDKTLRVWDLENGRTLRWLEGHVGGVNAVAVTPDGRRAVSGSSDKTLRVWDLESGQPVRTLHGHTSSVYAMAITPDGRRAVSGSLDNTLRVWDLESGQTLRTLQGHNSLVNAVAVTPDGRRAVSGSYDKTLRVWDLESGKTPLTLQGHAEAVRAVGVTPDGRRAVSGSYDKTVRVWDLESGQTLRWLEGHTKAVNAVALSPDGRRAVSGSEDRTLRVWNLESGDEIDTFTGEAAMNTCVFTPDGQTIIAGESSGRVHFLQIVEADETKPAFGQTKIQFLNPEEQSSAKLQEASITTLPAHVFISYAHADNQGPDPQKRWLDRFVEFLRPLVRQEDFTLCSDQEIKIGEDWHQQIQAQLNGAKAVVLLISPAFLASDYIANSELPVILKNAADKGVRIFPILISPSLYKRAKYKYPNPKTGPEEFRLSSLQAANPPDETLIEMREGEQDLVLLDVAEQLADLLGTNPQ
jgi:hypothetical protein